MHPQAHVSTDLLLLRECAHWVEDCMLRKVRRCFWQDFEKSMSFQFNLPRVTDTELNRATRSSDHVLKAFSTFVGVVRASRTLILNLLLW